MTNVKPTRALHDLGQSLWLDNMTRDLLGSGALKRYIDDLSVTGLTSNPTIFDHALEGSTAYDGAIREGAKAGRIGEALFFDLAIDDLSRAADLFLPGPSSGRTASTAGCPSRSPRCSPTTAPRRSTLRRTCSPAPVGRTCTSRSPARRRGSRPSRRPPSPACR